jgi:hypothetical protein
MAVVIRMALSDDSCCEDPLGHHFSHRYDRSAGLRSDQRRDVFEDAQ